MKILLMRPIAEHATEWLKNQGAEVLLGAGLETIDHAEVARRGIEVTDIRCDALAGRSGFLARQREVR